MLGLLFLELREREGGGVVDGFARAGGGLRERERESGGVDGFGFCLSGREGKGSEWAG